MYKYTWLPSITVDVWTLHSTDKLMSSQTKVSCSSSYITALSALKSFQQWLTGISTPERCWPNKLNISSSSTTGQLLPKICSKFVFFPPFPFSNHVTLQHFISSLCAHKNFGWRILVDPQQIADLKLCRCVRSSLKFHPVSVKCLILALMSVQWSKRTLLRAWREPAVSYPRGIVCASKTLNFTLN